MNLPFTTLQQFNDFFKDEKTCYEWYEQIRWADGQAVCPHCASAKKPYTSKARGKFTDIPSYRCSERACSLPFTVRTASIFEGSKVEFRKWLLAIYELNTSKKGISSVELGTRLGVSQKTAWFMNHRLRTVLIEEAPELLCSDGGDVEVDEAYIGGEEKNKHASKKKKQGTGYVGKTPVLGMKERGGKVVTRVIKESNGETIKPIIRECISTEATVITDGFGAYAGLNKEYAAHETVNHTKGEYVRGKFHTNGIENFWSLLERGITGIYHYVSEQHLHRYCLEFGHRYNICKGSNVERFSAMVSQTGKERITYRKLTDNGKGKPRPHKRKVKTEAAQ